MRSILFSLLLLLTLSTLHAQPDDRWRTFSTEGAPNQMRHYVPANGKPGYVPALNTLPLLEYLSSGVLYEYWAPGPTCVGCNSSDSVWRSNDGGTTWQPLHNSIPYRFDLRGDVGIARRWSTAEAWQQAMITTTGDGGWHILEPFPGTQAYEILYDTIPADGMPRFMAVHYTGGRLAITTDGGATWNRADSMGYTLDSTGKAIDSGLVSSTLFSPAPVGVNGRFGWIQLLALKGTRLTLLSSTHDDPTSSSFKYYFWDVDLSTMQATVRPMAADTAVRAYYSRSGELPPGNLMSVIQYASPKGLSLAVSFDMGNSWTWRNDSIPASNAYDAERTLCWTSPSTFFTSELYSNDTGRTWRKWYAPFHIVDMNAADSLHIAAAGIEGVYTSSDAGRTWKSVWADAPRGIYAGQGVVMAELRSTGFSVSYDSAEHWTPMALPENVDKIELIIPFDTTNDPNHFLALVTDHQFDSGEVRSIIESIDRGATWSLVGRTPQFDSVTIGKASVVQAGASRMIFLGVGASTAFTNTGFYVSRDSGRSWERRSTLPFGPSYVHRVTMLNMFDSLHGVGSNYGMMMFTSDGGVTWTQKLYLGVGFVAFDSLHFATLVTDPQSRPKKGTMLYTFDGGQHWTRQGSQVNDSLVSDPFYWIDSRQVYCTTLGRILFSSDSGGHFDILHPGFALAADEGLFDGNYIYIFSPDSAKIGRWRVTERPNSSGVRGEARANSGLMVRVEGSRIILTPEGPLPERWQPALVDILGRERQISWQFNGAHWIADGTSLPAGRYIIAATGDGVRRIAVVTIAR